MTKTVEQRNREINQIRRDQRNADEALLLEVADSLPNEHLEKAGLIRAAEILRHEKIES